jgi:cation transport regulator
MPYESVSDLPEPVRKALPVEAQKIFLAAYNNAWNEYEDPENRKGNASREEVAFKVAWAAVKKKYRKENDRWRLKK